MNDQATVKNRRVRVFVSSTFRDMMEERNELMAHTWPQLRKFCRERQVELTEVDLRWGITEEQGSRKETLKICLDEIHSCRPFFIGLLGERYGWVPNGESFTPDLTGKLPWLKDLQGRSVTELEILHGVLNDPEMAGRAFFYFRDPAYSQTRGADFQAESLAASKKQTELKAKIRATCAVKDIPLKETYDNPHELAALVLVQLEEAIEVLFPKKKVPDDLTREAQDHEAFAEMRRRTYISRTETLEALDRHAAGDGKPLAILGESGGGKSALLANWVHRWGETHPDDFVIQHYIGGTADSASHWRLMSRLIREIQRWTSDPDDVPTSHEDILRDFPLRLSKARIKAEREGVRCIVVLDALNQLEEADRARLLGWLPEYPFFGPLRLIVSTLPGECQDEVKKRGWSVLLVEPLTEEERKHLIEEYLNRFTQKLDAKWVDLIAGKPASANPLYLKILLDELRVTGTHEGLGARLAEYLENPEIPSLLQTVLTRYERDYERDHPGLVSEALGLIWTARRGLSESELLRLLRPNDLPQLPQAVWSPLRSALDESLIDRAGILNFAHDFLRSAVETKFAPDETAVDDLRLRLADFFESEPISPRSCDELPWLLDRANQPGRLRTCLLDIDRFLEVYKRDPEELRRYWVHLGDERSMGQSYFASFQKWEQPGSQITSRVSFAANQLASFLYAAALHLEAESLMRRALQIDEQNDGKDLPNVASILNNLAQLLQATNRPAEAERIMRRALQIDEQTYGKDHPDVATILNNLAQLLKATNRLADAEPLMRRALQIDEQSYGKDHP